LAVTYIPLRLENGSIDGLVGIAQDVTEQKNEESRLLQLSQLDALTGLLNRAGFEEFLKDKLRRTEANAQLALLYLDLDRFKPVNDTHGHLVGDELLKEFAKRLKGTVRPTDGVARLGGDEFAVIVWGVRDRASASVVARNILAAAQAPFAIGSVVVAVDASIGAALATGPDERITDLVGRADAMLYRAKSSGRGRVFFDRADDLLA
jgi:diguanylate cyclase (GGDEF)-like protein